MKLKLKELQALDAMLHAYSISKKKSYKIVIKMDSKIISAKFLHFMDTYEYPVEFDINFSGESRPRYINNQDSYLFSNCLKLFYNRLDIRHDLLNRYENHPDLLINELLNIIIMNKENTFDDYMTDKIYKIHFLESNLYLDFYIVNPDEEFELVSLILESEN